MPARSALRPTSGVASAGSRRERRPAIGTGAPSSAGIRLEDAVLEGHDRGRRVEPELLAQDRAERGDAAQRIGGTAAAVQGDGELVPGTLAERVLRHERLQLGDDRAILAEGETGRQQLLARRRRASPRGAARRPAPTPDRRTRRTAAR